MKYWIYFIVLFLSGCQANKDDTILYVGLSADYPPFEFMDKGELKGLDVDLARLLAIGLGKKIEFKEMPFSTLMPSLEKNHIDLIMAGMTVTPERLKRIDFSDPYYNNQFAYLYAAGRNVDDLQGKKIGVQLGSSMEIWAKKTYGQSMELTSLENNNMLIEMLKAQKIDAVVLEAPQAVAFKKSNPGLHHKTIGEVGETCAIALAKNSPLKTSIDAELKKLKESGKLQQIIDKWINLNDE